MDFSSVAFFLLFSLNAPAAPNKVEAEPLPLQENLPTCPLLVEALDAYITRVKENLKTAYKNSAVKSAVGKFECKAQQLTVDLIFQLVTKDIFLGMYSKVQFILQPNNKVKITVLELRDIS